MERENTIRQVGINDILDASERINAGITYTDKDIIVIEHLEDMTERGSVKLSKDMIMIIACLEGKMQVNLNAGSKLTYPVRFVGKRRIVALEGEAYFEVVQDESHPFVVQTHLGEVMVLGTAFNVNAYTDASVCYTTLVHGKVQFSAPNVGTVTLQPGEQAVVSANGTEKRTVDLDEYIGWVNGVYNFKNRSLGEIMETFERWYDIQVYYETPDLRDITYSGSLKRYGAVNSFLDALELTGDLTYKISGRKVLIYDGMKE